MHPVGRATLLEGPEAFPRLGIGEAAGHADAVVEAEVAVDAGLDDPACAGCGPAALREKLFRLVEQIVVGHDSGHQAPVECFGRAEYPPGEHQVAGAYRPDDPGEHLAVVGVGVPAEQLGDAEGRAFADHGNIAAQSDLEPTALAKPVDRRDDRLARGADRVERGDVHAQRGAEGDPIVGASPAAHVAAGREHVSGPSQHQTGQPGVFVEPAHRVAEPEVHRGSQRVARLRAVDGADGDRSLTLERQVRGAQPIAFGRAWGAVRCRHGAPLRSAPSSVPQ